MSMIFDRFPSRERAEAFRAAIETEIGLDGQIFDTEASAQAHDPFPWRLDPPIVHIDRSDDSDIETRVINFAPTFGGRFAGT